MPDALRGAEAPLFHDYAAFVVKQTFAVKQTYTVMQTSMVMQTSTVMQTFVIKHFGYGCAFFRSLWSRVLPMRLPYFNSFTKWSSSMWNRWVRAAGPAMPWVLLG